MSSSSNSAETKNFPALVFYAFPGAVMAMPLIPAIVLIPAYYADNIGIGLAQTGLILLLARLTDVISDPLVGWLSEWVQRRSAHGRKLQVMVGGLIAGYALYNLFTPPQFASSLYLLIWYSLMLLGWTVIQVPYLAWVVDLTGGYNNRVRFNVAREFFGIAGILVLGGYLFTIADLPVSEQLKSTAIFILIIGLCCLPFLLLLPSKLKSSVQAQNTVTFANLAKNHLFLRLIMAWFVNGLSIGVAAACFPLFVKYGLGLDSSSSTYLLFIYFVSAIAGMPVWLYLCQLIGKHRAWSVAMIMACCAFAFVPFLVPQSFVLFAIICVVTGVSLGADLAIPPAIQTDVADWDNFLNKADRSSFLFSLWSMATKLSLGLGVGLSYLALGNPETGSTGASDVIDMNVLLLAVIYGPVPIVLKLSAVGIMWGFPLNAKKHRAVRNRLERRDNKNSSG